MPENDGSKPFPLVACPTCNKSLIYSVANPFRPFCSERCKTNDLAGWADERFKIAGKDATEEGDPGIPLDPDD